MSASLGHVPLQEHQDGVRHLALAQVPADRLAQRLRVAQQVEPIVLHLERTAVRHAVPFQRRESFGVGTGQQAGPDHGGRQQHGGLALDHATVLLQRPGLERGHLEL
ncbi:MAG: hypothetical protein U5J97_03945 [Trueperaceae bacterium]|nr:hypothetical protein [Trueperaceae bacterium]